MHIKPGTWEASNAACEADPLCDPAVLVSPPKPEPHIRNRRLSPGSGSCGGGGGGCAAPAVDKPFPQASPTTPAGTFSRSGHTPQPFAANRDRERRAQNKGRGPRREGPRAGGRGERPQRPIQPQPQPQKERWVEDSLSLLKPPPVFPVKDSPAKLQPAVSYASKVKSGGGATGAAEEPPGIGMLLQNQWGLSFISEGLADHSPGSHPTTVLHPVAGEVASEKLMPVLLTVLDRCAKEAESSGELLLTCRHLVEAMQYHTQEWDAIYHCQKKDPAKVIWYSNSLELPA